ncbi:GcrA family cell cycle regulator [Shinella zoogloeoides]|uniref:GcrA family cell cycle regulator n=1 Tax=Shinella zoogloeoides TaxID=352475 RepID=UPI00299E9A04|nr:GcrA family cell cycle regulator [Shinella zoogloeoides]
MTTDERIAVVTKYALEGLSAAKIAAMIEGATRNSVIGVVHRNKILLGRAPSLPRVAMTTAAPRQPEDGNVVPLPKPKPKRPSAKPPSGIAEVIQLPARKPAPKKKKKRKAGAGVSIMDLGRSTCRGPLNENYRRIPPAQMLFCGKPTRPDSSWCEECASIYVTGRIGTPRTVDKDGTPLAPSTRKRKPFYRWRN